MKRFGLDIGSTTMKGVLLGENGEIQFSCYERHFSKIKETFLAVLEQLAPICGEQPLAVSVSGSAGMGFAEKHNLPFVQEVWAERLAATHYHPGTDAVIELDGEDARSRRLSSMTWPRTTKPSAPLPPGAAFSPNPTCSPS